MRVLLLRPSSSNDRFGLGPFFRVEPLGLLYLARALAARDHDVSVLDLRVQRGLHGTLRRFEPELVGISCTHTVDFPETLELASTIKRLRPGTPIVVGGHAATVFDEPLHRRNIDALCVGDGEAAIVAIADALARGQSLAEIDDTDVAPSGLTRVAARGQPIQARAPARAFVEPVRSRYFCLNKAPIWAIETARGCPYRCNFCSVRQYSGGVFRVHPIEVVIDDFAATGPNAFVIDDLFFHPRERSVELARALDARRIHKDWLLVQSRLDTVARNPTLLEAWRPLARSFDIFFGFEAPTNDGLARLGKRLDVTEIEEGVRVARALGFGVTGNFVVDPRWDADDFQAMWDMVDRLALRRVGYTVLTPLPGTSLYDSLRDQIRETDLSHYDMHHIPFEPRLGRQRFYELFVESWKRNVVGSYGLQDKLRWFTQVPMSHQLRLMHSLVRARRLFQVDAHLAEAFPAELSAP